MMDTHQDALSSSEEEEEEEEEALAAAAAEAAAADEEAERGEEGEEQEEEAPPGVQACLCRLGALPERLSSAIRPPLRKRSPCVLHNIP
jgi:hypothetical protein